MPHMICKVDHLPYAGHVHTKGDIFFVEDEHEFLFLGEGRAVRAHSEPEDKKPRRGRYRRADVRAEE